MRIEDLVLIKGALDTLAVCLADYEHVWSDGEKEIYDQSIELLDKEIKTK